MKKGGKVLKSVDKSKNPGLAKLPTAVRNKMGFMKSRQFDPTFCLEYIYNLLLQKASVSNTDYSEVSLNDRELHLVYRMIRLDNQIKRKLK